jgi:ATP-binding cassette subfamily F protein 3
VGPNGAGKTTLLRTIVGQLPPLGGALDIGRNVQLGYLAQLRDAPIPGATVLDAIQDELPITQGEARKHLARFLFRGDDALKELTVLSGGERSRLELALLFLLPANLLLLDEPTNHLDIPAREALEDFMTGTDSTLLIVSHDRRLLETVCEKLWVVDDGLAVPFDGGYRAWRTAVADGWTAQAAAEREALRLHGGRAFQPAPRPTAGALEGTHAKAGARSKRGAASSAIIAADVAETLPGTVTTAGEDGTHRPAVKLSKDAYRRRRAQVDEELVRLGVRRTQLEAALSDPSVHGNFVELRRVTGELAKVGDALAAAEEAWLRIEESAP